jgi:chromosome segregation protein
VRFTKLRLSGFKSFVDPTELLIEPGVTGVVGPNGCGKSNLVEALRWVMGETSPKQMRGGAMDDVIFNGTHSRASRNLAEVTLAIDNADRTAPAAFNDGDELVVLRKIERESGSTYRVNGKEARARDVQLLFADAATGAHSPALVSQGRVGALIGAKPTDRRSLLEEAAGITGLHSRRHEAELRLRGAEANLERLQDVMTALEGQLQQVKRQARQAQRYRKIGEQIRRFEAIALHLRFVHAAAAVEVAEARLKEAEAKVAELTSLAAQAATAHANAAELLPGLRQTEAESAARLQRLAVARDALEAEARAAVEQTQRLEARIAQTDADAARERALAADAAAAAERLAREAEALEDARASEGAIAAETKARVDAAAAAVGAEEREFDALNEWIAAQAAQRNALARQVEEGNGRIQRLAQRVAESEREKARLEADLAADDRVRQAQAALAQAEADSAAAIEALERAEAARGEAERRAAESREAFQARESEAARLAAEDKALSRLLAAHEGDLFPPLIDALQVAAGYERALGAALGEDLERPVDEAAPVHWATLDPFVEPPALPAGAEPLTGWVQAPPALARRLSQIGVVEAAEGPRLRAELKQGQRLVTRDGALWRWDGYTIGAGAETPAAVRLAQRNRLTDLRAERLRAEAGLAEVRAAFEQSKMARDEAQRAANSSRDRAREAERRLAASRQGRAEAERQAAARATRLGSLAELLAQLEGELTEFRATRDEAARSLDAHAPLEPARERLAQLRQKVAEFRSQLAEARAAEAQARREAQARADRFAAVAAERRAWTSRAEGASARIEELTTRRKAASAELEEARARPGQIGRQRDALLEQIAAAEAGRREAAHARARRHGSGQPARRAGSARRSRADHRAAAPSRPISRLAIARLRQGISEPEPRRPRAAARPRSRRSTATSRSCSSEAVRRRQGASAADRERRSAGSRPRDHRRAARQAPAGAVAALGRRAGADRALADLRGVPHQPGADLRAGRSRRAARRRQRRAVLQPGGRDGADLDHEGTRFLIITHNPITMARMDRLFGVTMAERGVSQLVSVDLAR